MDNLLLLDNDERIVELLSWFLGERGFSIRVAHSFAEARERIAEQRPDLLISDVDLGRESAVDELPRLSAEGILPPTLVVSGYLDAAVRGAIMAVPEVLDTLAKPFEFPHLEEKVRGCLAGGGAGEGAAVEGGGAGLSSRGLDSGPALEAAPAAVAEPGLPQGSPPGETAADVATVSGSLAGTSTPAESVGAGEVEDDDDEGWVEITGP